MAMSLAPGIVLFVQLVAVDHKLFPPNPVQVIPMVLPQETSPVTDQLPAETVPPLQINLPLAPTVKTLFTVKFRPLKLTVPFEIFMLWPALLKTKFVDAVIVPAGLLTENSPDTIVAEACDG